MGGGIGAAVVARAMLMVKSSCFTCIVAIAVEANGLEVVEFEVVDNKK